MWCSAFVGDAAFGSGSNEADVFGERAADGFGRWRHKGGFAGGEFGRWEIYVDFIAFGIDGDGIAIFKECKGAADLGFGGDVSDDESVGATAEATVCEESDVGTESGAHDGGGGCEHFGHSGAALRPFVANDDDVAFLDASLFESGEHEFFGVEAAGGSGEDESFLAGDFGNGAFGADIAAHDANVSGGFDGFIDWLDDFLAGFQAGQWSKIFGECFAGNGEAAAIDETFFEEVFEDGGCTSDGVKVFHDEAAAGFKVGDEGHAVAD